VACEVALEPGPSSTERGSGLAASSATQAERSSTASRLRKSLGQPSSINSLYLTDEVTSRIVLPPPLDDAKWSHFFGLSASSWANSMLLICKDLSHVKCALPPPLLKI
jgi:hypothetical protein